MLYNVITEVYPLHWDALGGCVRNGVCKEAEGKGKIYVAFGIFNIKERIELQYPETIETCLVRSNSLNLSASDNV